MDKPIRLMIADDHPLVRQGLRAVFTAASSVEIVAEAGDGVQALDRARETRPDVLMLDLRMPRKQGIDVLCELKKGGPATRVIVLTSFTEDELVLGAIRAGADGFILKDATPEELVAAVHTVARGGSVLHPSVAALLIQAYREPEPAVGERFSFTPTELHVLHLLADGLSNRELATKLKVSVRTVTTHVRNILAKLGVDNRTKAAIFARERGI